MFMKKLFVGEVIRKRRMELGLKQYELCEGICEPVTCPDWKQENRHRLTIN